MVNAFARYLASGDLSPPPPSQRREAPPLQAGAGASASALAQPAPSTEILTRDLVARVAVPTVIPVAPRSRVRDGELFASSPRIEGRLVLQRTFGVAALTCPTCSKPMRVLPTSPEPPVLRTIVRHLGVRVESPATPALSRPIRS